MTKYLSCLLFLFLFQFAHAQSQSPDQFLGYPLGTKFTYHHQIVGYIRALEKQNPDRVKIIQYGTTNEGRPLITAFISSAENISRLESIRTNHLKSIKMLEGKPDGTVPPIVWLSYNVHGNEAVSANSSMKVAYELLNKDNALTQGILKNTVVIIDPCENPDGYDRYTQWYNRYQNATPDVTTYALEHDEPWPGGRFNHYLFDLNRDWAWQTQKETKARIALYNQWMPHLHADFHEMGANRSYYFPPAAKPFHKDITAWQREFNELVGENCRRYFDKNNWAYFTRYNYDLFYPSYGDTWPTFNGAIGITYEQAGGGQSGLAIDRKREKDTLTLVSRIDHHYATSLATLESVASRQERIIKEFIRFHEDAATNPAGTFKTYVVKTKGNEERVRAFTEWLSNQGFQYGQAGKSLATKGTELTTLSDQSVKIESNDLLISAYQPKSNLIKVLFETKPVLEDSVTYDLTSWGVSYLFGLKAYGLKEKLTSVAYQPTAIENKIPDATPYAYLARWSDVEDVVFLSELLKRNMLVRSSNVPFEMEKMNFDAGTLVITKKGNNEKDFDTVVTALATKHHVQLIPVKTGFVTTGQDFGSEFVPVLKSPKIVTVGGPGVSATSFGSVWHYFEQQINYPMTVVDPSRLASLPWAEIDVLILPDGRYSGILSDKVLDQLQAWVRNGGKIIAMEKSTESFAGKSGFGLTKKNTDKGKEGDVFKKYGDQERVETSDSSPGSMYNVTFDRTHPISFGLKPEYYMLVRDAYDTEYLKEGWNVGYLTEKAYMAGFVGQKMTGKLKNTLIMGVQPIGRGSVVYMMDDPLFRGMLYDGKILFSNAVFR
ncbi:M14 family metallopeptidase [Dyadobacter psychrotolerans]|uniref:Zinc carboxypeptidase n=1 Tax=Dyadobacter psychrotolerans TaxID=2541721 RepID=A0A4R5DYU1_9BACT|nr:M14 family metallopeptidase [Dyadobacter psychrotolerans]TDE16575.1 zinc carboxypeptidase [Dyadobacter psychrotolerans]